ncbi:OmpA family protein [Nautilia lithotrophica]
MYKILIGLSISVATLLASNQYELGFGIGRNSVDNSPIENYNFLNARIGKYLPKNHILRLELERSEKVLNNKEHLTRALLNVEHYFPLENSKFMPYAYIGAGYQWVSGNYDNNIVADLGIGAKYFINSNFNTFLELRGLRDFGNNDNHYGAILGINYKFGEEKKIVMPEVKKVLDSDNDGIADELDKCPNTPKGVKVDKNGCQIDSDGDGVYDNVDKCPNTLAGVSVDVNGCPVDSDGDGVADYLDKCPNTPNGVKVDKKGCALVFNFDITFDNNSAEIKPEFMSKVKEFAKFLKENPVYKAEIQGYTDSKGSAKYNKILSEKRAKAVYEALIDLGVDPRRLSYKGFGEENPIASNDTAEGKAKNRRVIAKLFY